MLIAESSTPGGRRRFQPPPRVVRVVPRGTRPGMNWSLRARHVRSSRSITRLSETSSTSPRRPRRCLRSLARSRPTAIHSRTSRLSVPRRC